MVEKIKTDEFEDTKMKVNTLKTFTYILILAPIYYFSVLIQTISEIYNYYLNFKKILVLIRYFIDILLFIDSIIISPFYFSKYDELDEENYNSTQLFTTFDDIKI